MIARRPAQLILVTALVTVALLSGVAFEANAQNTSIHVKMWSQDNLTYAGKMTDVVVAAIDQNGAILDTFTSDDIFVNNGEFFLQISCSRSQWDKTILTAASILIESNELVEIYDLVEDVPSLSFTLWSRGKRSKSVGGLWNGDSGGNEPLWDS